MKYEKLTKWLLALLFVAGVVLSVYGFIVGWPAEEEKWDTSLHFPVDLILWGAYIFAGITILSVVFGVVVIGGINNPKSLVKLLIAVVAIVAVVGGAWFFAPGTPAIGYLGDPVSDFSLKLTDATLILTYASCGAAILSLVIGWIVGATRK
jgi:hypothetical protein